MYFLLVVCILLFFPINYINKTTSTHTKDKNVLFCYCLYTAAIGTVLGFFLVLFDVIFHDASFRLNTSAFLSALLFGSMTALCQLITFYTLRITTVAVANMCNTASVLIPTLFGIFLFEKGETAFTLGTGIGIVLFFIAAYLISSKNKAVTEQKPFTKKTLFACLGVFISNGFGSVSMQIFSSSQAKVLQRTGSCVSASAFMFYTYAITTVILAVFVGILFLQWKKKNTPVYSYNLAQAQGEPSPENEEIKAQPRFSKFHKTLFVWGILSTAISFFINQGNTIMAPVIPDAVLFPSLKSGALLMGALAGWSIFKEKLSAKNIIGIVLCIAALIVLKFF